MSVEHLRLFRSLLWPAVCVILITYFGQPLKDLLIALTSNVRSAQAIDLGYVKITGAKVAPPDKELAKSIKQLDRQLVRVLMQHQINTGYHICDQEGSTYTPQYRKVDYDKLVNLGMVRYQPERGNQNCSSINVAWLTDLGKDAQLYLQRLIVESIAME